jgi:DNA-binding MarR family transcriptional regulator
MLRERGVEINPAQGRILFVLWEEGPMAINELAKRSGLVKSTLTSTLDRLEAQGQVVRVRSREDRRKITIELTPKNHDMHELYDHVSKEMARLFYRGFAPSQITTFEASLHRILQKAARKRVHAPGHKGPCRMGLYSDVEIIYPVHLNPNVKIPATQILSGIPNIHLVDPLDYFDFVTVMKHAYLILTDSGGVQEEAPSLGIPVLVLRNETERPEAVFAGTVRLVGTKSDTIISESRKILDSQEEHQKLAMAQNPYGDGNAAERITNHILKYFRCH